MLFIRNSQLFFIICLFYIAWPAQAQDFDIMGKDPVKGRVHRIQVEQKTHQEFNGTVIHAETGDWLPHFQIEYDKKHRVIKEKRYYVLCGNGDDNGRTLKKITANNQLIELIYGKTGVIEENLIHTKGEDGRLLTSDHYDANGGLLRQWLYSYEIDHMGNWVRREACLRVPNDPPDGYKLKLIERRSITYYQTKTGVRPKSR